MAQSITQRIIDAVIAALKTAAPVGRKVRKGRKSPQNESQMPMVQVYWHQETPVGVGNPRKPMMMTRHMVLELKVTVAGEDDAFDIERQWVVAAMWNAGTLDGLAKNISEAETVPFLEESSVNDSITAGAIRYAVEYATLPGDLTAAI
jgi:hypothetical protein